MHNKENLNPEQENCKNAIRNLTIEILKNLQQVSPNGLKESCLFFNEVFLNHVDDDLFESKEYRLQWKENISRITLITSFLNKYPEEELKKSLKQTINVLETY
nr:hypothetical protein [uncultured Flavobacterium sp.]